MELSTTIEGFEDYRISSDGTVWNARGKMKSHTFGNGYHKIRLWKPDKSSRPNVSVHRLVANAFVPNPDNLPWVDHIDGNRLNNDYTNLRWCTPSQNNSNKCVSINNKLGIKNICQDKTGRFCFYKRSGEKYITGSFKTLEEAIAFKDSVYENLGDEFSRKN